MFGRNTRTVLLVAFAATLVLTQVAEGVTATPPADLDGRESQ
jgi:hypothetical protein